MAHDQWDKLSNEVVEHYAYDYHPGVGGYISKQKDNSVVIEQKPINKPMTRPEVEEALAD
jgi:hypothetical protein